MKKIIFIFILLFLFTLPVFSFQFEPMIQDFSASGINSRRSFQIINNSDELIAIKISMVHRDMDIYGEETLKDASELFFVFPTQVIVRPHSRQTIRVQWLGNEVVATEQPFRILVEQLPINIKKEKSGVNILINYHGSIYVVPEEIKYEINVASLTKVIDDNGDPLFQIELENSGNTHIILKNPIIRLSNYYSLISEIVILHAENLPELENRNVLAGKSRVFLIPWPEGLNDGELNATISVDLEK